MSDRRSGRNPRLRLSCARCQRRKIRCDAQLPTCSNCRKATVECQNGESLRLRGIADETAAASGLRARVRWLESIIRDRLPDVQLSDEVPPEYALPLEETRTHSLAFLDQSTVHDEDVQSLSLPRATSPATRTPDPRAHEIGLIAVGANSDHRYVGPSSGYFLARLLLSCVPRMRNQGSDQTQAATSFSQSIVDQLVEATHGPRPLPSPEQAFELAHIYFEVVHFQYPILNKSSIMDTLHYIFGEESGRCEFGGVEHFQLNMIFAIASSVLSFRTGRHVPGESYCLSALQCLDQINVQNTLSGLQCVLLLLVFTMHSPKMRLNVWYLNYHCIAAVLELGLQRDVTSSLDISPTDKTLRESVFWTVFALDRTIATMMGRPIGLRDEACELKLPDDSHDFASPNYIYNGMDMSNHLFRLAKLVSEIKYVANSIVRDTPRYAYPAIGDIIVWQEEMLGRLHAWDDRIPPTDPPKHYFRTLCLIRSYSTKILVLRPSPAIPKPSAASLRECYHLSWRIIQLYNDLYRQDLLIYDWIALHNILFSTITALYCLRAGPDLARESELHEAMYHFNLSLSLLSAAGEHWSAIKRSRHILHDLGTTTIEWMRSIKGNTSTQLDNREIQTNSSARGSLPSGPSTQRNIDSLNTSTTMPPGTANIYDDYWFDYSSQLGFGDMVNVDQIIQSLFDDFIPQVDSSSMHL